MGGVLFGALFMLGGALVVLFGGGGEIFVQGSARARQWRHETGLVVRVEKQLERRTRIGEVWRDVFYPVVEHRDANGRAHRRTMTWGTGGFSTVSAGDAVPILVDPQDEGSFEMARGMNSYRASCGFIAVGGVLFVIGGIFFILLLPHREAQRVNGAVLIVRIAEEVV